MLESGGVASRPKWVCGALLGVTIFVSAGCGRGQVEAATPGDGPTWGPGNIGQDGTFLMIPPGRLAAMRAAATAGAPAWKALKANVEAGLEHGDLGDASLMNVAVAYLVSGDRRYCERLTGAVRGTLRSANPRGDSYYNYAGIMADLATTLSYCGPLLDAPLRGEIVAYLDKWTDELWFHNQGSGWGLKDPGNNYHISFLLGTAWAGLALQSVAHPSAPKYLGMVAKGVDEELAYIAERCPGGGWAEGTNYGEGSKGRLADLLSLVAAAGMKNVFQTSDYFAAVVRYAHYQLQPGNEYLYPAGDMARESNMTANPYTRGYVQQIVYWLADSDVRAVGQWYLDHVVPNYRTGFNHPQGLWRDVVYKLHIPGKPQGALPLSYWAKGDNFVSMRSGWDAHATALMVSGASKIDQSHAHLDTGGFTLWRDGWQVVDAVTYSHSGLLQEPGAHNLIHVDGARKVPVAPKGLLRFVDDPRASYLQIDATGLYARGDADHAKNLLLGEMTREMVYLKPDTVIVYDRVEPASPGTAYAWRLHFPERPAASGSTMRATHDGGGVTVALLVGDAPTVVADTDLAPDGSKTFRAQATSRTGRFLAALRVASGSAPKLDAAAVASTGDMEGVAVGGDVVLFSKLPFGKAPAPGFSYTVPSVARRVHTLVNMSGSVGVAIKREGGNTVVTIGPGADQTASPDGVIRFTE
jgi:hypothetical protein